MRKTSEEWVHNNKTIAQSYREDYIHSKTTNKTKQKETQQTEDILRTLGLLMVVVVISEK